MPSVKEARIILRDAEIEELVEKRKKDIDLFGRCPNWRGHFDLSSFVAGMVVCFMFFKMLTLGLYP